MPGPQRAAGPNQQQIAYAANGPPQVGNGLGVHLNVSGSNLVQGLPMQQPRIGGNSVRVAHASKDSPSIAKGQMQVPSGQRQQMQSLAGTNPERMQS